MRSIQTIGAVLVLAGSISSCDVLSFKPSSNPVNAKPDQTLCGRWVNTNKSRQGYVQFETGSGNLINVSVVGDVLGEDMKLDPETANPAFQMFTSKIGKYGYMNVRPIHSEEGDEYLIVRYLVRNNRMTAWLMDKDKVRQAIEGGKLRGEPRTTKITDTSDNIEAYLRSPHNPDLFQYLGDFDRSVQEKGSRVVAGSCPYRDPLE